MAMKNYKVIPYGARKDVEDNEWVYYELGVEQDNGKPDFTFHPTALYPYAFVFLPEKGDRDAFVYHTLISFVNMDNGLITDDNTIEAMDKLSVNMNTMQAKAYLVENLKKELEQQLEHDPNTYKDDLEVKKCLKHCNKYLEDYENALFDCARLRIIPMHINGRSDIDTPVHEFTALEQDYALKNEDEKKRIRALYEGSNVWNVKTSKGAELELDGGGVMNMVWDMVPDATVHRDKASEKNISQEIHEKGIKSYDLYTFVLEEEYDNLLGAEHGVYNVFWDGDVNGYDDTLENMDSMLYEVEGLEGFKNFVRFMEHNKFIPQSMIKKWREFSSENSATVVGIYRAYFRTQVKVNYEDMIKHH